MHPVHYFSTQYVRLLASNSLTEAEGLIRGLSNASACLLDVEDREKVSRLVEGADVVIRWVTSDAVSWSA